MTTARPQEDICRLVKERTILLETETGDDVYFTSIVVMKDKLLVTDVRACNVQIYNIQDGKRIYTSEKLDDLPWDACILNENHVAVCLWNGKIIILLLESMTNVERVKTVNLGRKYFRFRFDSVIKLNSDKIIVTGLNLTDKYLVWYIVSVEQESVDSIHNICQLEGRCMTHLAVKDNILYVSCNSNNCKGVFAFDVLNPDKHKFLYQHQDLRHPRSVMVDRYYMYVFDEEKIHQLTYNGQLVTVHRVSPLIYDVFNDDRHGDIYTTSLGNVITVYRLEYPHLAVVPTEILQMDEKSIQLYEEALKDGKETVYSICVMFIGHVSAGKTTLVKRLLGQNVNIMERCSTEGIDVHVNCCNVSLSTHEWTKQIQDSEQDYKLQRLVKVLNENNQTQGRVFKLEQHSKANQKERIDEIATKQDADDDNNTEILYNRSLQDNGQNNVFTSSLQKEPSSTPVLNSLTHSDTETLTSSEPEETGADPLREMLKMLQQHPEKTKQDVSKYAQVTMLDFAGECAFYTTHQMFLRKRAIYVLVSDSSKEFSDFVEDECFLGTTKQRYNDLVDIWMNSIHSCASTDKENLYSANSQMSDQVIPPPVILVGTHIDQIPQANRRIYGQRYLKKIRKSLKGKPTIVHLVKEGFAIDNSVVDSELEKLKKKIVEVAMQQSYWGEQIPTRWFVLEQQMMRLKDAGTKVLARSTVEELNKCGTIQIKESEEFDVFLKYLHETGTIIYFSIETLRDEIILDPKWLIDALKILINAHQNLPESLAENGSLSCSLTDNASQPHVHTELFKEKGILTTELVDAIWTQDKHPDLPAHKDHLLRIMEQFNIIAKPRSFNELGVQDEKYFLVPCMLRNELPPNVIFPEQDPTVVTTPGMRCIFTGGYLPLPIFHRLLAACVAQWPVAKKEAEYLISCNCSVFNIDLLHRLTLYIEGHVISAKMSTLVKDEIKTPDAKLCSKVRRFITRNLDKITSNLGQNLQFEFQALYWPWLADDLEDPNAPIRPEHIRFFRLSVVLISICGRAMRDILSNHVPSPHIDINRAILANRGLLTGSQGRALLNSVQCQLVFPDSQGQAIGRLDHFDLSLLYILIRNISSVPAPLAGWGKDLNLNDTSLGASVERIRALRNIIVGHSADGQVNQQEFGDYWNQIDGVLHDIENALGHNNQNYRAELERQKNQVISVYEACGY